MMIATRDKIFAFVAARQKTVTVGPTMDEAAEALGIERSLVAYHLKALVKENIVKHEPRRYGYRL